MSQRLHIGATDKAHFDCVVDSELPADELKILLRRNWFACADDSDLFLGPLKIMIGDLELWRKIKNTFIEVFQSFGFEYPGDIWQIRIGTHVIESPTAVSIDSIIKALSNSINLNTQH